MSLSSANKCLDEYSRKIGQSEAVLEEQASAVKKLNLLQEFMIQTSELKSVFRHKFLNANVDCASDLLNSTLTALKSIVENKGPLILGASSVRLMQISRYVIHFET